MKSLLTIAVSATLLFTQACSSSVKSGETPISTSPVAGSHSHEGHSTGHSKMPGISDTGTSEKSEIAQAKLTVTTDINTKNTVPLVIDVQDEQGKAIAKFDTFQEKLMHLIVVSDDLQVFNHLHPTYKDNGRFEVVTRFPQPGDYTLFSDYKPAGQTEQVSVMKTQVLGSSSVAPEIDLNRTKTFADTQVNFTISQATVKSGEEVTLSFDLKDTSNNQPSTDLQPYLGERGHLVILRQSSPLTINNYIHAHALKNSPTGRVDFMAKFPQPGRYKLWGQFNRNGRIITADFWINVV